MHVMFFDRESTVNFNYLQHSSVFMDHFSRNCINWENIKNYSLVCCEMVIATHLLNLTSIYFRPSTCYTVLPLLFYANRTGNLSMTGL